MKALVCLDEVYLNKIPLIIKTVIVIASDNEMESRLFTRSNPCVMPAKYPIELRII